MREQWYEVRSFFMAIHLKITNSSEVVSNNTSTWFTNLTPFFNRNPVEEEVINRIIKQLSSEGIEGEISAVKDIKVESKNITWNNFQIRYTKTF